MSRTEKSIRSSSAPKWPFGIDSDSFRQALPGRFALDLDVGDRPVLRRVLPALTGESFEERFDYGVSRLLG